jgi:hypothetical protein
MFLSSPRLGFWPEPPRRLTNQTRSAIYWNKEVISLNDWWQARRQAYSHISQSVHPDVSCPISGLLILWELFPTKLPTYCRLIVPLARATARYRWPMALLNRIYSSLASPPS